MPQDLDTLIKIIIPIILLIFWALSNLFNREKEQNMARERATALGNRPANYPSARPIDRRPPAPGRPLRPNEEVMVIRAEPNRPQPKPNVPGRRNANRGRAAGNPPSRRDESSASSRNRDLVGGDLVGDMNQSMTRKPMEIRSLSDSMADSGLASASNAATSSLLTSAPPASGLELRTILNDPVLLRQAFILNEVFRPPVSQRGRGR
jgi:hypothetical protein